jgi:hypothetical protein
MKERCLHFKLIALVTYAPSCEMRLNFTMYLNAKPPEDCERPIVMYLKHG